MENKILIIGKIPPPLGGVTVHVSRLIDWLKKENIPHHFLKLNDGITLKFLRNLIRFKAIHLHASSPYLQLFISVFCFITFKKLLITYHGDVKRFKKIKSIATKLSIRYSYIPILLNEKSLDVALNLNNSSVLISSFIPPIHSERLPQKLEIKLKQIIKDHKDVFSTNASNLHYDKDGQEIYGISFLVECFKETLCDKALIISDPSGNYFKYLIKRFKELPKNVYVFDEPHSFLPIICNTKGYIRNTSTDGDSISIREAMYHKKLVYATDSVNRPEGVITFRYSDLNSLINVIDKEVEINRAYNDNAVNQIISLYKHIQD